MSADIIERKGVWWPEADVHARAVLERELELMMPVVLSYVTEFGCVVQAGGNVGLYPKALADHFGHVITVEPDETNLACFARNTQDKTNIVLHKGALSDAPGFCGLNRLGGDNCGAYQVVDEGFIQTLMIDQIARTETVGLIWLDIEGSELAALRGAELTITRCWPVIAFEDKGIGPSPAEWLQARGYSEQGRVGNDRIFVREK